MGVNQLSFLSPQGSQGGLSSMMPAPGSSAPAPSADGGDAKTREAFQQFVAGTFFQQMFKALRDTQQKPKYFHGGQAEEIFQGQLDQQLSEDLAKKHGDQFVGQLYDSFTHNARAKIRPASA